jgi:hypothetical protein
MKILIIITCMVFGYALADDTEDITLVELCKYAGYAHMLGDVHISNELLQQAFTKILVPPCDSLKIETRRCWDLFDTSKKIGLPISERELIGKKIVKLKFIDIHPSISHPSLQ